MTFDQSNWLSQNVLVKSDRASMHNGFELRAPLLSPNVLLASLKLNDRDLRFFFRDKVILRKLLRKKYGIRVGRKKGFSSPMSQWIKNNPDYFLTRILDCERFSRDYVKNLVDAHAKLKVNNSHRIYTLFVYSIWYHKVQEGMNVNNPNS
jgi:asparagine synthase (glutamine-hydrolysing)